MPRFTQSGRPLSLATPLPADTLLLASLAGTEAVSRPYRIELTLLAEAPVPFDALLGQAATVTLAAPGSPPRMIRGVLDEIDQDDRVGGPAGQDTFLRYRAVLVPRLDLLRHLVRSRVFQAVSVVDILTQTIKAEWGLDLRVETASTPVVRDYVVQYQESDLAFVSRLMEDEGLRYYFDHTTDRETLVVADGASAPPALHKVKTLAYLPASGGVREAGRVQALRRSQRITSTGASVRDYSFQKAASTLDADAAVQSSAAAGRITHALDHGFSADGRQMLRTLEFPAGHGRRFDGISPGGSAQPDEIAKLFTENARLAELIAMRAAASAVSFTGSTDLGHLVPGYAVTVANHFDADGDYLVTAVTHAGDVSAAYLRGADDFAYAATFALLPASIPFVPQKVTPRPRISGVQTAKVVGPKGQDIFVDPFGRVKVKFPWDRSAGFGPENSCWLRVSQIWAGRRWGAFFWPRVGHEVVVAFEEGDPDRPIVTGSVYNGLNLPPFELPANRVKAGIKSFSASGDIEALCDQMKNFNGIVFHDEKGNEHTEIHSERNHYHNAESNSFHNVNGTHRVNVSKAHSHHVGNIPSGSGSGGGDSDGPSFLFTTTTDMDKWFGINFTSVAGINHTNTLGLLSSFTVGEYAQIVVNPIGMAADGVGGLLPDKLSALAVAAAAPVGGIVGVTMGTNTQLSYGTPISIVR